MGITREEITRTFADCALKPGFKIMIVCASSMYADDMFNALVRSQVGCDSIVDAQKRTITFKNDSRVRVVPPDCDKIRGMRYNRVLFEDVPSNDVMEIIETEVLVPYIEDSIRLEESKLDEAKDEILSFFDTVKIEACLD